MIIKGGAAGNVGFWAHHLMRDDTNDEVRLVEISGLVATNLRGALREMQAIGRQSRSRGNFMYQANINPRAYEELTPDQWREAVDRLEKNLNLGGHQRVIVQHMKGGRRHIHVIWNRVDVETLKVVDIKGNYAAHARTARELEQAFGLRPTPSPDGAARPREKLWEKRADEQSGTTRDQVSNDLTSCWHQTETGQEFREVIEGLGYILARGDRRDFCVVDRAGRVHSLARRLVGVELGAIRMRFSDIDPASLPSVGEARLRQRARNPSEGRAAGHERLSRSAWSEAGGEMLKRRPNSQRSGSSRPHGAASAFGAASKVTRPRMALGQAQRQLSRGLPKIGIRSPASQEATRTTTQRVATRPSSPSVSSSAGLAAPSRPPSAGRIDTTAYGRAEAAYEEEMAKWQAGIDFAQIDPSLTPEQRAAAVAALRVQQRAAANGVRKRIIEEEKQRARAACRMKRAGLKNLTPAR